MGGGVAPAIEAIARREAERVVSEHERRMHAQPWGRLPVDVNADLEPGDLAVVLRVQELHALRKMLALLQVGPHAQVRLVARDGSPWLELTVLVSALDPIAEPFDTIRARDLVAGKRVLRLAMWRRTGAVHEVGPDGAVADDPIYQPRGKDDGT